jgi:hypothetical protein
MEVAERLTMERANGEGIYKSNAGEFRESTELKIHKVSASTPEYVAFF